MSMERGGVSIPANITNVDTIQLTPLDTPPAIQEGLFFYDNVNKTITLYTDEPASSIQLGQEMWVRAENNTGDEIENSKIVFISGANGELPEIALGKSDKLSTSTIIGMVTGDIPNGTKGLITTKGLVRNVNTDSFSPGDPIYLSSSIAGDFTKTKPEGLNSVVLVGSVIKSDISNGTVLIETVNLGRAETPRAEIYVSNNSGQTTIENVNDWETVVQLTSSGSLLGFTFDNSGSLTADNSIEDIDGSYRVSASISSSAVSANKTYEYAIAINDVIQEKTISRRRFSSSDVGNQVVTGEVSIVGADVITLKVRNVTDDTNIIVSFSNFNISKLGG